MWSVLENILCALICWWVECSVPVFWSIGFLIDFQSSIYFLIFCMDYLSIIKYVLLKCPNLIILMFISHFSSGNVCFIYLDALMLTTYIYIYMCMCLCVCIYTHTYVSYNLDQSCLHSFKSLFVYKIKLIVYIL